MYAPPTTLQGDTVADLIERGVKEFYPDRFVPSPAELAPALLVVISSLLTSFQGFLHLYGDCDQSQWTNQKLCLTKSPYRPGQLHCSREQVPFTSTSSSSSSTSTPPPPLSPLPPINRYYLKERAFHGTLVQDDEAEVNALVLTFDL